jgi:periplasmic protein CpxP/Spy
MKSIKALILFAILASSQVLLAQQPAPSPEKHSKRPDGPPPQRPMADAPTRARKMTDRMTKDLGLNEATSKKVYAITLARATKVDQIQSSNVDGKAKNDALKANADDFKAKLKSILTADQFAKFEAMKKDERGPGGPRGEDGLPPPPPHKGKKGGKLEGNN